MWNVRALAKTVVHSSSLHAATAPSPPPQEQQHQLHMWFFPLFTLCNVLCVVGPITQRYAGTSTRIFFPQFLASSRQANRWCAWFFSYQFPKVTFGEFCKTVPRGYVCASDRHCKKPLKKFENLTVYSKLDWHLKNWYPCPVIERPLKLAKRLFKECLVGSRRNIKSSIVGVG